MDPHKNRIGNCESCLKMRFLEQIPEKCENANSNAKSFKNAKKMRAFLVKAYLHAPVCHRESSRTIPIILYDSLVHGVP